MKRPVTTNTKHEEEFSDTFSTTAPNSNNAFVDDNASPDLYHSNSNSSDDTESLSDDSRKNRKKRNAYQKISDDIRVKLLDAVQNGETLKAAAKRYKINYSSAKSILHTYRKEGRILKKSAQERTTKKRSLSEVEPESLPKPKKAVKKENVQATRTIAPLVEKIKSEPSKEAFLSNSIIKQDGCYTNTLETNPQVSVDYKPFDNYFITFPEVNAQENEMNDLEGPEFTSFMQFPKEFDSFNNMTSSLQTRSLQNDDIYNDMRGFNTMSIFEDRPNLIDNIMSFEENGENSLKSFMDTQGLFRNALRKDSMSSYTGGFRKGSIDLF